MKKSFNIQKLLHHKSTCHGTKPMHPSLSRAFQSHEEHDLKHLGLMVFIITKQNKLPSFINIFQKKIYIFKKKLNLNHATLVSKL